MFLHNILFVCGGKKQNLISHKKKGRKTFHLDCVRQRIFNSQNMNQLPFLFEKKYSDISSFHHLNSPVLSVLKGLKRKARTEFLGPAGADLKRLCGHCSVWGWGSMLPRKGEKEERTVRFMSGCCKRKLFTMLFCSSSSADVKSRLRNTAN